jgi:tetratricopeptide (TPR) repeat protein
MGGSLFAADSAVCKAIETGKMIEKVVCLHDTSESYCLYLPSNYTETRKWPVLFAFDFEARTTLPTGLFKTAAEKYGYIIICSSNTRNGRKAPILKAMQAIWQDAGARFSIDKKRVYATGLSGGSRISSVFHMVIGNPVRGIIAVGAGIAPHIKPRDIRDTHYFGICGYADFNYKEMLALEKKLANQGTPQRFLYYLNKHEWPPQEMCTRGLEWMELTAIKQGIIPADGRELFIAEMYEKELSLAIKREEAGEIFYAAKDYQAIARTFERLTDVEEAGKKAAELSELHAYKLFHREDNMRIKRERYYYRKFAGAFNAIKDSIPNSIKLTELMKFMGFNDLRCKLKKNKNPYETSLAVRTLYTLIHEARAEAKNYMRAGDYRRALIVWEIAGIARKYTYYYPDFYIDRACTFARLGYKKKAVKYLQKAVEHGYINLEFIEHAKDFDSIRSTAAFRAITRRLAKFLTKP